MFLESAVSASASVLARKGRRPDRTSRAASAVGACRYGVALAVAFLTAGCSLLFDSSRPTPGAHRNVFCALEYRPDPARPGEPDILFLAAGMPYKVEEFYMSLPDGLVHTVFAPARHLSEPVHLRGLSCSPPGRGRGHRLPGHLSLHHFLLCRREGLEPIEIEVRTKWGSCRREIPAGDAIPHCREWFGRTSPGLRRLSPTVCPSLPQPTANSRRGTTPSGAVWVVLRDRDPSQPEGDEPFRYDFELLAVEPLRGPARRRSVEPQAHQAGARLPSLS